MIRKNSKKQRKNTGATQADECEQGIVWQCAKKVTSNKKKLFNINTDFFIAFS